MSLRQLRDPSDGIAGIAADSLRINGAMRPFRQVRLFNCQFFFCQLTYHPFNVVACQSVVEFFDSFSKKKKTIDFRLIHGSN